MEEALTGPVSSAEMLINHPQVVLLTSTYSHLRASAPLRASTLLYDILNFRTWWVAANLQTMKGPKGFWGFGVLGHLIILYQVAIIFIFTMKAKEGEDPDAEGFIPCEL